MRKKHKLTEAIHENDQTAALTYSWLYAGTFDYNFLCPRRCSTSGGANAATIFPGHAAYFPSGVCSGGSASLWANAGAFATLFTTCSAANHNGDEDSLAHALICDFQYSSCLAS